MSDERVEPPGTHDTGDTGRRSGTAICVTGMHRSGTSLVAMWLNGCGVEFERGQLGGARRSNKKGHFEDKRLVDFHELVIRSHLPGSRGWIVTRDAEIAFSPEHQDMARRIITSHEKPRDAWGWKDPRMAVVLESWKELIPGLKTVIVWRSADAVVRSLLRRSRGTTHKPAKLNVWEAVQSWKAYNRKILAFCDSFPGHTLLVPLDCVIKHDREVISLINSKFDVNLQAIPISEYYESRLLTAGDSHYSYLYPGVREITRQLEMSSAMCRPRDPG